MKPGKKSLILLALLFCAAAFCWKFNVYSQEKDDRGVNFRKFLEGKFAQAKKAANANAKQDNKTKFKLTEVCPIDSDPVAKRVFADYGAIFVAAGVFSPTKCVFSNEEEVSAYQNRVKIKSVVLGGTRVELQESAMNALLDAQKEAGKRNLKITPRGGATAARRSYQNTQKLWDSRFYPALNYWTGKGRISAKDAQAAKVLPINEQVARVLDWEKKNLFFSTDFSKSILYSVAAPGASQHIFMLALDVEQFANAEVRGILAKHGWFQTVKSDMPHFTYLGLKESELPSFGLKAEVINGQKFWTPNL